MRVKLVVAYDGTAYCGWQVQNNGISVQGKLNEALSGLFQKQIQCIGASRTDAGVHAEGNVCVFDVDTRMPAEKIAYALNQRLPEDIAVVGSSAVDADFHPRFDAKRKTYEYRIWNARFPNPILRNTSHFFHYPLDTGSMMEAGQYLLGEHDFTSFASIHAQTRTFVRTLYSLQVEREASHAARSDGQLVRIRICGNGFLYNMVRIIAGTLIQVGSGMRSADSIPAVLEGRDRSLAGPTAPAKGLILREIEY